MLKLKSITSLNMNGHPLYSNNLSKRIFEYKKYIKENTPKKNIQEDELVILTIQGLHGYRVGLLGWIVNQLSYRLSQYSNPVLFQSLINRFLNKNKVLINDYELFSFSISMLSRSIPIINILNWNPKENFLNEDIFNYSTKNLSMPSIFNLSSLYLLNPLFDSGLGIYSNKSPTDIGFERWKISNGLYFKDRLFNKGVMWSYYQSIDKKNGITIFSLCIEENDVPDWVIISQFNQVLTIKDKLKNKYDYLQKYETYIIGDFKVEFNLQNIIQEINEKFSIFRESKLEIVNINTSPTTTHFILRSNDYNENIPSNILSNNKIEEDDILNIEFEGSEIIINNIIEQENPIKNDSQIISNDVCVEIKDHPEPEKVPSPPSRKESPTSSEWVQI
jgi:hypothetical protein